MSADCDAPPNPRSFSVWVATIGGAPWAAARPVTATGVALPIARRVTGRVPARLRPWDLADDERAFAVSGRNGLTCVDTGMWACVDTDACTDAGVGLPAATVTGPTSGSAATIDRKSVVEG